MHTFRLSLAVTVALMMLVCFYMFIAFLNKRKTIDSHRETTKEWTQRTGTPPDTCIVNGSKLILEG